MAMIKRRALWLALICSSLLIFCDHALQAEGNPEPINWTVVYTADTLPNLASPAWTMYGTSGYTSVQNGIATVDTLTNNDNEMACWCLPWGASAAFGQIIEVRLKVYPGTEENGVYMNFSNDVYGGWISFFPEKIYVNTEGGHTPYYLDTTDAFHTYRITCYGSEIKVYVDGAAEPAVSVVAPPSSPPNRILWGDGTGTNDGKADWDYIKYCTNATPISKDNKDAISKKYESERRIISQGKVEIEVTDYSNKVIYHSPETPGYTSWVGLWQIPGGNLRCSFSQIIGPTENHVISVPNLESSNGGDTWSSVPNDIPVVNGRGMVVLKDGTLVRGGWGATPASGYVQRSIDNGKTWGENIYFISPEKYRAWPTIMHVLRDGRIVLMAGCWLRGDGNELARMTKMMFVSNDGGKTWSEPITLMPTEVGVCEESDFCELPNGDLFWIHRTQHYGGSRPSVDRMQSIVRKSGDQWIPGTATVAPFPHDGSPAVLYTNEGLILSFGPTGIYCTADTGKTWTRLPVPGTAYYPIAVQISDGRIIDIGHRGGDENYGSHGDQAIMQQTFRLKITRLKERGGG